MDDNLFAESNLGTILTHKNMTTDIPTIPPNLPTFETIQAIARNKVLGNLKNQSAFCISIKRYALGNKDKISNIE